MVGFFNVMLNSLGYIHDAFQTQVHIQQGFGHHAFILCGSSRCHPCSSYSSILRRNFFLYHNDVLVFLRLHGGCCSVASTSTNAEREDGPSHLLPHYVFALGIARFLDFAYWIIMIIETRGRFFELLGIWELMDVGQSQRRNCTDVLSYLTLYTTMSRE